MRKVLLMLLVFVLSIAGYYWYKFSSVSGGNDTPRQEPIALKKHSDSFNLAITNAMNAYFDMSAAFVEADTAMVKKHCHHFIQLLDSIPMAELKADTANIYTVAMSQFEGVRANAVSLVGMMDIQEMRKDFSMISENLYPFFTVVNYEGEKMYWQNCPMAFDDDKEAQWFSKTRKVVNPYLGKNHPVYRGTMLNCGLVKDSIMAK